MKWLWIALVVILIGGAGGYYFYADNKAKEEAQQARIEKLRQDPIAAAELEAARLDSIRQDSLFRNFSTPDMAVFDVHGHVKSIALVEGKIGMVADYIFSSKDSYPFDDNGKCINPKIALVVDFLGFKYDKFGRIVGSRFSDNGCYPNHEIEWNCDSKIVREFESYGSHWTEKIHKYSDGGDLISTRFEEQESAVYGFYKLYFLSEKLGFSMFTLKAVAAYRIIRT